MLKLPNPKYFAHPQIETAVQCGDCVGARIQTLKFRKCWRVAADNSIVWFWETVNQRFEYVEAPGTDPVSVGRKE